MISLLVLVRMGYSAPTLSSTKLHTTPTTNPETTTAEKLSYPAATEAIPTLIFKVGTTPQNNDESASVQPTTAMEDATEKATAGETSTVATTTEEVMAVKTSTEKTIAERNETVEDKANTTKESLKNVTASTNATNSTEAVKDYGPSSILYPVCSSYLGIQNKRVIKDDQMFASSTLEVADLMKLIYSTLEALDGDSNNSMDSNETSTTVKSNFTITGNMTAAHDGRLGNAKGSWCASGDPADGHHHLIVDLGKVKILEGVITQGRSDSDNWVTEYTVQYSSNNRNWFPIKKDGTEMVFKGNKDRKSMVVGSFPHRIAARYVKFTPKSFHGKLMCMRVEAIGCNPDAVNVAKYQPVKQSSSERNLTLSSNAVDGAFVSDNVNEICTRTETESSPWLRIDLRRVYHVKEIFISHPDKHSWDMWDFEVRVGKSLDNEGNDNALCHPLYTLQPGQIGTIVCKNGTVGRYVNIRIARDDSQLSLCEVAVIGVAETIVKLGLKDIANSLQTGSVIDDVGDQATAVVGGLLGKLYGPAGGALLGQGMGALSGLKGQGMGMLSSLGGQGMGMLQNLQGQGMGMLNNLKGQGLGMANKLKDKGLEMANKMKEQGMEMANKAKEQAMEAANKMKEQGMEMANKAKEQAMEAGNKAKEQAMEAANKAKEQGMAMANDLQNQGMGMVGDMQGQMNQQQDKFKKKLKEMLEKGKEYLEVGKEEMEKFKKEGYIETGKEYVDIGLGMMMDGVAFIQAKLMESLSNIAGDMSKQIMTLSEYDTNDIKGLLDDVDPVAVRNFVEEAKPKIGKLIDDMQRMAKKYLETGIEKAEEAKTEIESEAESAKNDATAAGKNVANKAKNAGMGAVNKAKAAGMDAVNKAKEAGMDAVDKAKSAGKDAVNKAKKVGMGALDKAKSMGMGALDQAKGLGMGMVGDLKSAGMGALGQAKGLGMNAFGQLKQAGMGALGSLQGLGRGMLGKLSKAGEELLKKAKNMKLSQVKELQQVQMLLELKKMKEMKELEKKIEMEQDSQWEQFERFSKEMEDEIKLEEMRLEGEGDGFEDNDVPGIGGAN